MIPKNLSASGREGFSSEERGRTKGREIEPENEYEKIKDRVLSILHCALQKSAAIFLMLKNPIGLIALCNPFASAMSVVKRLFMYRIF